MGNTDTHFESLLDQVEQLHQAITSGDSSMGTIAQVLREKLGQVEVAAAWFDRQELLRWWLVAEQLPPLDVDVLVSWGDGRGTYIGAYVADHGWVGIDSMPFDKIPRYWCALPIGPVDPVGNS